MLPVYIVWFVEEELSQMRVFLDFFEHSLIDFENHLENKYSTEELNKIVAAGDDDPETIEYEKYIDLFQSLYGDFPRRQYCSFLVSWYSFIEMTLLRLCKDLELGTESKAKRPNKGIRLAKELLKYKNINIEPRYWNELITIGRIRNRIVHSGGEYQVFSRRPNIKSRVKEIALEDSIAFIEVDFDDVLPYILRKQILRIYEQSGIILPTPEYCHYLVNFGKVVLMGVFKEAKLIED